jgi:Helix-turn-helix of DDE superfamily endonuclease
MTYEQIQDLPPGDVKRAGGVHPHPVETMLQVLRDHAQQKVKPGRPSPLSLEHQLLMTLQDWREYRTSFPLGLSWGVDASVVCRTVQKSENLLSNSQGCHVPGKKKLRAGGTPIAVIVVEVADSPLERPPKNSGNTPAGRRSGTPRQRRSSSHTRRARSSVSPSARDARTIAHCSSGVSAPSRQRAHVELPAAIKGDRHCTAIARPPRRTPQEAR